MTLAALLGAQDQSSSSSSALSVVTAVFNDAVGSLVIAQYGSCAVGQETGVGLLVFSSDKSSIQLVDGLFILFKPVHNCNEQACGCHG